MEEWKSSQELDDHFTRRVSIKLPEEEDEEKEPDPPKLNKAPTMKYDMQVLKTVNAMEEVTFDELVALYEVESEDDLPVDFDIFKIIEKDKTVRRQLLADMLADCPNREGSLEFIDKFLDRVNELNRPTAEHSAADSE